MWKRRLVGELCGEWGASIRRVCRVLMFDMSSCLYLSRRPGQVVLEKRIEEICQARVRSGHRRMHAMLPREGWSINQRKTRRIYPEVGLQLRSKTPKRRVEAKFRAGRKVVTRPNGTWAMDFVHDQLAGNDPGRPGQRVRIARFRPVGLCPERDAGHLMARRADRQRLYRGLQRAVPGRMPERALAHEPRRCSARDGGLE